MILSKLTEAKMRQGAMEESFEKTIQNRVLEFNELDAIYRYLQAVSF